MSSANREKVGIIMRSYSEIHEFIEENDVEFIRLAYFDVFGTQKNIAIMSGELERAMKYGISIVSRSCPGSWRER